MPIIFRGNEFKTQQGKPLSILEAISWSDTARARKIDNIPNTDLITANVVRMLELLKKAYEILECDADITSFFRCIQLNALIGGMIDPPSAHMEGRAVDSIPHSKDLMECFAKLSKKRDELQFDQLILEHDKHGNMWLHLSVPRSGSKPRLMAFQLEKKPSAPRIAKG